MTYVNEEKSKELGRLASELAALRRELYAEHFVLYLKRSVPEKPNYGITMVCNGCGSTSISVWERSDCGEYAGTEYKCSDCGAKS